MDYLPTSPLTLLSVSVPPTPHGVEMTKITRLQVSDDRMAEILGQMEKVLNIMNSDQALSESLPTHVSDIPARINLYFNRHQPPEFDHGAV